MAGKHRSAQPDPERDTSAARPPLRFLPLAAGLALVLVVGLIAALVALVSGGDDGDTASARGSGASPSASTTPESGSASESGSATPSPSATGSTTPSASAPPSVPPSASPSAVPTPRPGYAQVVLRVVGASSWARVRDGDGRLLQFGVLRQGASRVFSARVLTVEIGNAGAVELVVNGRTRSPLGRQGQISRLVVRPTTR